MVNIRADPMAPIDAVGAAEGTAGAAAMVLVELRIASSDNVMRAVKVMVKVVSTRLGGVDVYRQIPTSG